MVRLDVSNEKVRTQMEDGQLKNFKKKLEVAINDALLGSAQINTAIKTIRERGFDVFLIIEATIGFNTRANGSATPKRLPAVRLELTTQDEKFLRSLKISPD